MSSTIISVFASIIVALVLLISFFVGRKRGVTRTLVNGGITIVGLVAAFFLTPVVTGALMGISVTIGGTTSTAGEVITQLFLKDETIGVYLQNSGSLQAFTNGIMPAVCSVIVFLLLCLISKLLMHILYKIVEKLFLPSKEKEAEEGRVRNRLGGGVLAVVKTFLFLIVVFMPFTSLTQFVENNFFEEYAKPQTAEASGLTDTLDSLPSTAEISNEIPSDVKKAIAGYNNSLLGWCGNIFGIGDLTFDYLSKIDVNGSTVSLRSSAEDFLGFYDYIIDLYDMYKEEPQDFFANIDYEKFDTYKEALLESGVFKGLILNVAADYVENYEEVFKDTAITSEYKDIMEDIKACLEAEDKPNEVLLNDFYKIFDILKAAGQSGYLDAVNELGDSASLEDILHLTFKDYTTSFVSESIDAVFNIKIVRSSFVSIMDLAKDQLGDGETENILKTADANVDNWEQFIFDMKDIVTDVGDLYNHLTSAGVNVRDFMNDYHLILKAEPTGIGLVLGDLGSILDKVNKLEIMTNVDSDKLLNPILDSLGFGDLLNGIIAPAGRTVNYAYAMEKIAPAVRNLLEYDLYDEIKAEDYTEAICKIADAVYADSLLEHGTGVKTSQEKLEEIFKILYEMPKFKELTVDAFADNLSSFVDISVLNNSAIRNQELRYMTDILIELAKNQINVGGSDQSFLRFLLTEGNDFEGLIDAINEDDVYDLLTPILKSKMTNKICDTIFTSIEDAMAEATGKAGLEITYTKEALDDQAIEICKVFKKFVTVHKEKTANGGSLTSLEDISYPTLGGLLDAMKENAYRNDLYSKGEDGIFLNIFTEVINTAETTYDIDFETAMNQTHIHLVNFTSLFNFVEVLESDNSGFVTAVKALMKSGGVTETNVKNLFDSITTDNAIKVLEILLEAAKQGIKVNTSSLSTITIGGSPLTVEGAIDNDASYSNYNATTAQDTTNLANIKAGLKNLLM